MQTLSDLPAGHRPQHRGKAGTLGICTGSITQRHRRDHYEIDVHKQQREPGAAMDGFRSEPSWSKRTKGGAMIGGTAMAKRRRDFNPAPKAGSGLY